VSKSLRSPPPDGQAGEAEATTPPETSGTALLSHRVRARSPPKRTLFPNASPALRPALRRTPTPQFGADLASFRVHAATVNARPHAPARQLREGRRSVSEARAHARGRLQRGDRHTLPQHLIAGFGAQRKRHLTPAGGAPVDLDQPEVIVAKA